MLTGLTSPGALAAFGQVALIDVVLAGDNAIVVGALAAGLPTADRRRVILLGTLAALLLRLGFALVVQQLLGLPGLVLAGGIMLLWVAWRMGRGLRAPVAQEASRLVAARTLRQAAIGVAVADVSMSLDNVLAVAGAARGHPAIMVAGLILSVALMGLAANLIAAVIDRTRWIAYAGLAVIVFIAARMIHDGARQLLPHVGITA